MLVLFASPGRRPGHGRWRVANPPAPVDACVVVCFGGFVGVFVVVCVDVCVGVCFGWCACLRGCLFWGICGCLCGCFFLTHVLTHVPAGLQPACVLLRVCNPRHACFVHFPGSQTRPRMLAGCKPARTWMLAWLFVLGCGCLRGCLRGCLFFEGCVFAWLFVKDFCQSCRGKGLQANPLTHKRIRKRPVMQCKTGRLGLPDRPFWRAKEAVWHGHTAGMARRAARCKNFSRCGSRGGRGASSLRQYDAVQAMPAAITRSRMALSCSGVALRSSRSGVSRSMVYIITLPGAMYLTFSSHGPT